MQFSGIEIISVLVALYKSKAKFYDDGAEIRIEIKRKKKKNRENALCKSNVTAQI